MIRVVSFFCVTLMGLSILTLYHISEQARVARQDLRNTERRIAAEQSQISVLEAQWQKVAGPEVVQKLAEGSLGMNDAATVQLSSLTQLPRRGDAPAEQVHVAAAPVPAAAPIVKVSMRSGT